VVNAFGMEGPEHLWACPNRRATGLGQFHVDYLTTVQMRLRRHNYL